MAQVIGHLDPPTPTILAPFETIADDLKRDSLGLRGNRLAAQILAFVVSKEGLASHMKKVGRLSVSAWSTNISWELG
jgi:hypothetical protein